MKPEESQAFEYLSSLGFKEIVYEPDGKVPPDFLLNRIIAVEVRRLNQHFVKSDGTVEGLETSRIAVIRMVKNILSSLSLSTKGQSWFVNIRFRRPLPAYSELRKKIQAALFRMEDEPETEKKIFISPNFRLSLLRASHAHSQRFLLGGCSDMDCGGWLGSELQRNVQIAVEEKTKKIEKRRSNYPEWWLILVDQVGYGMEEPFSVKHDWDKVVLINPQQPSQGYEV